MLTVSRFGVSIWILCLVKLFTLPSKARFSEVVTRSSCLCVFCFLHLTRSTRYKKRIWNLKYGFWLWVSSHSIFKELGSRSHLIQKSRLVFWFIKLWTPLVTCLMIYS